MCINKFFMRLFIIILITLNFATNILTAQSNRRENPSRMQLSVIDNDTVLYVTLKEIVVIPPRVFKNKREEIKYTRLVHNVKVTLPYARIAAEKLYDINSQLEKIEGDKERKNYLKQAEKDLFAEFEAPIRKLTFSQGKVLIKLIDRETGNTGYELIKEHRGGVSAFFWQGIARIFGANLKDVYLPEDEDAMIEYIVNLIDWGVI